MPTRWRAIALVLLAACDDGSGASSPEDGGDDAGARTYTLVVPASYDASKPTPLVVMLHGYGASAALEESYLLLTATARAHGFLYAYADGTIDPFGRRFWNATDACCNFAELPVDDVAYIDSIVDDVSAKYAVDPKRVFLIGHSNGGFMAHRYACDRAARVAAIVSFEGATWNDASKCAPSEPVSVVEIHGDADTVIAYDGGSTNDQAPGSTKGGSYPPAPVTASDWAAKNACTGALASTSTIDLDTFVDGGETEVGAYGACPNGGAVELWTVHGGTHAPPLAAGWGDAVYAFLSAHPKP